MPKKGGKKKKGKFLKPGMEMAQAIQTKFIEEANDKMKGFEKLGIKFNLPKITAAQTAADSDSAADVS